MKTPQRKFVVEFKSGRRRSTTQTDSIWGNTDLKAFVRQAETEAPHLFQAKLRLDTIAQSDEVAQDQDPANQLDLGHGTSNQSQLVGSLVEPAPLNPPQNHHDHAGPLSQSKMHSTKRKARKASARIGESRSGNHVDSASDERRKGSAVAFVEGPVDDLAALDADNQYLKTLLIEQLRQENLRLRTMLKRFGVS
ncbi:hypothetical protein [Rhizobium sp. Nf11,1]|uniref:hypothetical protein n=1 Tax=unclassified Rhizobium TaxID=2613769 RepID=UPI003D344C25